MEDNTNVQGDGKTHDDTRDSSETLSDMSLTSSVCPYIVSVRSCTC